MQNKKYLMANGGMFFYIKHERKVKIAKIISYFDQL